MWTFGWAALSLNDAKRDFAKAEIVYGESMMAVCLLDLFRTIVTKTPHDRVHYE